MERQPNNGRRDVGYRPEGARRQLQDAFDPGRVPDEHREDAILARPRRGEEPRRDLPLKHDGRIHERQSGMQELDEFEQDGGRDVVRKISGHAKGAVSAVKGAESIANALNGHVEKVALHNMDVARARLFEQARQIAIDFVRQNVTCGPREKLRHHPAPGSDLEQRLISGRRDGANELLGPYRFEEVLSKSLARAGIGPGRDESRHESRSSADASPRQ